MKKNKEKVLFSETEKTIIHEIKDERCRQIEKWGYQAHDMYIWLAILSEEVGELSRAVLDSRWDNGPESDIKKEAIQVAAVAHAILESLVKYGPYGKQKEEVYNVL